jgi:purine-nucleoside phosphorylase
MGAPSAGIVFEELCMLGAKRLIRVGTCGGLQKHLRMADTVIGISASADDQTPIRYCGMTGFAPTATFSLVEEAARLSRAVSDRVFVGPIVTSGLFYDPDPNTFGTWRRLGHLGVEMEASMMYTIATLKGIEALAIMTVSDVIDPDGGNVERISDDDLKKGVDQMMRIACQVAVS